MERATNSQTNAAQAVPLARRQELTLLLNEFNCEYAQTLDRGDVEAWVHFFTDDAVYRVIARDNFEAGLPLGLMLCDGKGMLKDRAYAIQHTEMYAPRYVHHQISMVRLWGESDGLITAEASYAVHETLVDRPTHLLQVGRYKDVFVQRGNGLLLKSRDCIFDSVVVPNCVVYPV